MAMIAIVCFAAATVFAQSPQSHFRLGAYLGLQGTAFHGVNSSPPLRPGIGFIGGGVVSYPIGQKWSAQLGVEGAINSYRLVEDSVLLNPSNYPNGVQEPGILLVKFHDYSVHIPVMFRFHLRTNERGLYGGLGPDLRFSLKSTQHTTVVTYSDRKVLDSNFQLAQLHVGIGLQAVVGSLLVLKSNTNLFWESFFRLNQLNTMRRSGIAAFDFGIRLGYQF
jgi:Outer membrane protein beta-barrel domain